jgi:hypothetical protein
VGRIIDFLKNLKDKFEGAPMPHYFHTRIEFDNLPENFKQEYNKVKRKKEFYFQIFISEIILSKKREWFNIITPAVSTGTSFRYGPEKKDVPNIVGPTSLNKYGMQTIPVGFIIANIPLVGPHPYRGDNIEFAINLCALEKGDYITKTLNLIEGVNSIFPIATMLSQYLKVADVVFDGIKDIIGPAKDRTGKYTSYNLPENSGYYLITNVDTQKQQVDKNNLVVENNELFYRDGSKQVHFYEKFAECDYVLYCIQIKEKRTDMDRFFFNEQTSTLIDQAIKIGNDWQEDVMPFIEELGKVILKSPDLTDKQSKEIWTKFVHDALDNFKLTKKFKQLPGEEKSKLSKWVETSAEETYSQHRGV